MGKILNPEDISQQCVCACACVFHNMPVVWEAALKWIAASCCCDCCSLCLLVYISLYPVIEAATSLSAFYCGNACCRNHIMVVFKSGIFLLHSKDLQQSFSSFISLSWLKLQWNLFNDERWHLRVEPLLKYTACREISELSWLQLKQCDLVIVIE